MKFGKQFIFIIFAALIILGLGPRMGLSAQCGPCEKTFFQNIFGTSPDVTITSADPVAATDTLPEHCEVRGTISPELDFVVKLPKDWNERFYMIGNGGSGGTILEYNMIPGLQGGYATAGENTGHNAPTSFDWSFGWPADDPVGHPDIPAKILHFNQTSIHETAKVSKLIIEAYYCNAPHYSYYVGCSNGGRQGLMEAQRYPEDFDGLIIGAPVFPTPFTIRGAWEQLALLGDGAIPVDKLPLLADAVFKNCDGMDGLIDGLIDDAGKCTFSPTRDLPRCPGNVDEPNCFTDKQLETLQKMYGGATTSTGEQLTWGQAYGASGMAPDETGQLVSGFIPFVIIPPGFPLPGPIHQMMVDSLLTYYSFVYPPGPEGPGYDWKTFDFDTDPQRLTDAADANSPDLMALKERGGKIIHYHGWADPAISAYSSISYYEEVLGFMGEAETKEFYKLYMVPGMQHCGGGVGCGDVDYLTALVDWVENGIAPEELIGATYGGDRTRPLCPYPQVARYTGSGSINDEVNFTCVEIVPAMVGIRPQVLNLARKGKFTSFIVFPEGYDVGDIDIRSVTCEGASAVKGKMISFEDWGIYIAKFKTKDMLNVPTGDAVSLTATVIADYKGNLVAFEGTETTRVKDGKRGKKYRNDD